MFKKKNRKNVHNLCKNLRITHFVYTRTYILCFLVFMVQMKCGVNFSPQIKQYIFMFSQLIFYTVVEVVLMTMCRDASLKS